MILLAAVGRAIERRLWRLTVSWPWIVPLARTATRWYLWATDARLRSRLNRVGWQLVPSIMGAVPEPVLGYFRIRVVNPRAINFSDGFENLGGAYASANKNIAPFLWHSLGTEAGTDNSINYWTQDAGAWSYASHLVSVPGTFPAAMHGGHADWGDGTFICRFKWVTGAFMSALMHYTATNNWVGASTDGTNVILQKDVAGTATNVGTANVALTTGTFYWLQITGSGTTYTAALYNDSSGAIGTVRNSVSGTISDASLQTGYVALRNDLAAGGQFGGAFANVCTVTGPMPDGWYPVVTAGEPAFALSAVSPQAGTYSASIQLANSAGNGNWARGLTQVLAGNNTLACQIKASAGTANVSAGGVTTTNRSEER